MTDPLAKPVRTTLATPFVAVGAPRPVTEPVPVVWENVTLPPKDVTVLLFASSTVAVAVQVAPEAILEPQPLNTIFVATPAVKVTAAVWLIVTESVVSRAV